MPRFRKAGEGKMATETSVSSRTFEEGIISLAKGMSSTNEAGDKFHFVGFAVLFGALKIHLVIF